MTAFFEIAAVLLGLAQGVLVMLGKRSNWIFYTLQMAALTAFSILSRLYGDTVSSLFYFCLGIVGFALWHKDKARPIRTCSPRERCVYIAVIAVGTLLAFLALRQTGDPLPLLDAFTTVSSLAATYYMLTKRLDAWVLWLINDIAYVAEYWLLPDTALYLLLLNLVWTGMAVATLLAWKRKMAKGEPI